MLLFILITHDTAQICYIHLIHCAKHTLALETQVLVQKVALNLANKKLRKNYLTRGGAVGVDACPLK